MNPIRATLFNSAGQAWAQVDQLPDHIPDMLTAGDIGWARDVARLDADGQPTALAALGPYTVDPDTREILLESRP